MSLHPQCRRLLDAMNARIGQSIEEIPIEQSRNEIRRTAPFARKAPSSPISTELVRILTVHNRQIPVRLFLPLGEGPFAVTMFFHGGGFVLCDTETHAELCRDLCAGSRNIVVSVDYRRAPEHPFPAAIDDCFDATAWVAAHAAEFGALAESLCVCGDSAGGNLATATALRARNHAGPYIAGQILLYPMLGFPVPDAGSYQQYSQGYGLTCGNLRWFWRQYLASDACVNDETAVPLLAESTAGLPPTLIVSAECDPLSDDSEAWCTRLRNSGIEVEHHRSAGMIHGFLNWVGRLDDASHAIQAVTLWIRRIQSRPTGRPPRR